MSSIIVFAMHDCWISFLSLIVTLFSIWSTCCPSFLLYVRPISIFASVCITLWQSSLFFSWSLSIVSYLVALDQTYSSPLQLLAVLSLSVVYWETMFGSHRSLLARHIAPTLLVFCEKLGVVCLEALTLQHKQTKLTPSHPRRRKRSREEIKRSTKQKMGKTTYQGRSEPPGTGKQQAEDNGRHWWRATSCIGWTKPRRKVKVQWLLDGEATPG